MTLTNLILMVIVLGVAFTLVRKFVQKRKNEEAEEKNKSR